MRSLPGMAAWGAGVCAGLCTRVCGWMCVVVAYTHARVRARAETHTQVVTCWPFHFEIRDLACQACVWVCV